VILLAGMIANTPVLADAYRIVDEKMERCVPCEVRGLGKKAVSKKKEMNYPFL
jgi:hypothetical protein